MFSWDPAKAERNLRKHKISFREAAAAFSDPAAVDGPDEKHSPIEERRVLVGRVADDLVVAVVYTRRASHEATTTRIISARPASSKERKAYDRERAPDP